MKKIIIPVIVTSAITALVSLWAFDKLSDNHVFIAKSKELPVHYTAYSADPATQPVDFSPAAESSVRSVVHIMTLTQGRTVIAQNPFGFSGRAYRIPNQMGSGSGVIISADGYIVTNNHVVQGTDQVQVTFNNRNTQIAKVVGTDPATDLAVLKIDGKNLPYMTMGNSDDVKLGQWVLAVGYPLNLDATVTAGIVSAKSRSIGINQRSAPNAIESFIQTDAAVNQGNSGGALVNTEGLLIGINSAIASPTGAYAGYSYAIPSNIVQKVANDLIQYGSVQRAYLGIELIDLNDLDIKSAEKLGLGADEFRTATGVYINSVVANSGAEKAGLKKGDFITGIENVKINSSPQLLEQIARFNPGEKIKVDYRRKNKNLTAVVELKNSTGTTEILSNEVNGAHMLGAELRNLKPEDAKDLNIAGGVIVTDIGEGLLQDQTNIRPGFIIFSVNDKAVQNIKELENQLAKIRGRFQLGGIYPDQQGIYYYGLSKK